MFRFLGLGGGVTAGTWQHVTPGPHAGLWRARSASGFRRCSLSPGESRGDHQVPMRMRLGSGIEVFLHSGSKARRQVSRELCSFTPNTSGGQERSPLCYIDLSRPSAPRPAPRPAPCRPLLVRVPASPGLSPKSRCQDGCSCPTSPSLPLVSAWQRSPNHTPLKPEDPQKRAGPCRHLRHITRSPRQGNKRVQQVYRSNSAGILKLDISHAAEPLRKVPTSEAGQCFRGPDLSDQASSLL